MHDVVIIGAGPAGLSAALYTSRAGLKTIIIDTLTGGVLNNTEEVDNYLGLPNSTGVGLAEAFTEHAKKFGATVITDYVEKITKNDDKTFTLNETIHTRSIIIATGATALKLPQLEDSSANISYCATCDGMFYEGDNVVVVGNGNTAAEDALYLSRLAHKVTVLIRGDKWKAEKITVDKIEAVQNINVLFNTEILTATESEIITTTNEIIEAEGIFVAIGQTPNSAVAKDLVSLNENGTIESSIVPGIFVAGDVQNDDYKQVAIAVGEGARAGIDATRFLE